MKIKGLVLALSTAVLFSGCQTVESVTSSTMNSLNQGASKFGDWMEKSSINEFENTTHKGIRDKFLWIDVNENGRKVVRLAKPLIASNFKIEKRSINSLFLVTYVNHEANFVEANRKIKNGIYNSEQDIAAKYFVDQAKANGHEVRVYKSSISGRVNNGLAQAIKEINGASNLYDVDPVFVEYDKEKRVVAIMTRSWQTISAIGVDSRIYTNIYFGGDGLRWFENNFGNNYLENALLRVYR